MLYTHIHADISRNITTTSINERTHFFRKIYLSHFIRKGWCFLCVRGELETETDCHIFIPSSSNHSSTSFAFWWTSQLWVLRAQSLCLDLVLTPASISNWNCNSNSNWPKLSVVPGYIIVWHPPASCGRTHLHRIQPRPQVRVIFRYPRPDVPVSALLLIYTGASVDWRLGQRPICNTDSILKKVIRKSWTWTEIAKNPYSVKKARWADAATEL